MSSPAQPKVLLRQSLYLWVLLAMVGILSLSFVAFRAISEQIKAQKIDPVYDRFDELQLESARNIQQKWGQDALAQYLRKLDGLFSGSHYLLDGSGKDLVSGEDRSDMLPKPPAVKSRTAAAWSLGDHTPFGGWQILVRGRGAGPAATHLVISAVLLPCARARPGSSAGSQQRA